jgi:cell division septum initiation protein DivIVA
LGEAAVEARIARILKAETDVEQEIASLEKKISDLTTQKVQLEAGIAKGKI